MIKFKIEGFIIMKWSKVERLIEESLQKGFPGGQLLIEKEGEIISNRAFGAISLPKCELSSKNSAENLMIFTRSESVTTSTLFDIASLTKIFAVTYLFQIYFEENSLILEQTIGEIFQEEIQSKEIEVAEAVAGISIKALLSHHAGFEPNPLFYDPSYSEALYCQVRESFAAFLLKAPLIHVPETAGLYSDVDFMLLTFILEKIAGKSIEAQLEAIFWNPLALKRICYQPLEKGFDVSEISATERNGNTRDGLYDYPNIRTKMIHGEVQDEKAFYCMEGISGHAGIFSNAESLLTLFRLMYQDNAFFGEKTKQAFLSPHYADRTFGLGWRLNGEDMRYMFGDVASMKAYGHTGWTGCLLIHDPEYALTIIYLTNRKNTPVVNPAENPHLFAGDQLPAGRYLPIIQAIYQDLGISQ